MSLNQVNEEFNDAIQVYFPRWGAWRRFVYRVLTPITVRALRLWRLALGGERLVNERIIEYPQVMQWIRPGGLIEGDPRPRRVLDVGCVSSRLPIQLASLGYEVYGLDLSDYPLAHPNFKFFKASIFAWKPPVSFDVAILLSTLEHIGTGAYGDPEAEAGDRRTVQSIHQWLVPGGQLLVSVPFGQAGKTKKHRIYDSAGLKALFPSEEFHWVRTRYFQRAENAWIPVPEETLRNTVSLSLPVNGVAVLDLERK